MDEEKLNVFPTRLRQLRRYAGMTQEEVAAGLNIHRTTYTKYETGKANPDHESLVALSRMFHVSVDYLLGQEDTPEVTEEALENGVASIPLSTQEMELLQLFRRLTPAEQKQSLAQIREKQRTPRHSGDKGINR